MSELELRFSTMSSGQHQFDEILRWYEWGKNLFRIDGRYYKTYRSCFMFEHSYDMQVYCADDSLYGDGCHIGHGLINNDIPDDFRKLCGALSYAEYMTKYPFGYHRLTPNT